MLRSCWRRRSRSRPVTTRLPPTHSIFRWQARTKYPRAGCTLREVRAAADAAVARPSAHSADWPKMTRRCRQTLIELCDDPDRSVRHQAWMAVGQLKLKKALPVLEARLGREHLGFAEVNRDVLESHDQGAEGRREQKRPEGNPAAGQAKMIAELEKQLGELERKASELTSEIARAQATARTSRPGALNGLARSADGRLTERQTPHGARRELRTPGSKRLSRSFAFPDRFKFACRRGFL